MDLDRDEFVVSYDASRATKFELIANIKQEGFSARVEATDLAVEIPEYFRQALARAYSQDKPIVLVFTASWCLPCQRMLRETFPNENVARLLERFVLIKVDTDEHPALANKYGAVGLPDVRLLSSGGDELRRFRDFQGPNAFAQALEELLAEVAANATGDELIVLSDHERGLKEAFNRDRGKVRLVLILSPT